MKLNHQIQKALIQYLQGKATVLALLSDTHEIREDQWQGRNFVYPCIRLSLRSNYPSADKDGCPSRVSGSVVIYSETNSSEQADTIAGEVASVCHRQSFTKNSCRFPEFLVTGLIPAIREDDRTWRSEVLFRTLVE